VPVESVRARDFGGADTNIPFIGSPTTIGCIINYLVLELAGRDGIRLKDHQGRLEQAYRENDILFNLRKEEIT
jgi:hypothetical protein